MKDNDPFGMESIILWNAALLFSFILLLSLGSVVPLFNNALSTSIGYFSTKVQ